MSELRRLRRAGGSALRLLVELLPPDWDPRPDDEDVCIIFADVSGYSSYVADAGDDAAMAVLAALDRAVGRATATHRHVRVVKRLGDGVMLVARDSSSALDAAIVMVESFDEAAVDSGWPVRLRAGLHRGTTRRQHDDYFGYHVNLCARIAETATGSQVLSTAHALAGVDLPDLRLTARPAGELHAKGVASPVDLFLVQRDADAATGLLAG